MDFIPHVVEAEYIKNYTIKLRFSDGSIKCASTGYWGRIAVYEVLLIDDSIRGLILKKP